ncbi:MAG: EAL domain-containing protein [Pseudomonadota bacterium]
MPSYDYLVSSYRPFGVLASVLIATLASYVSLDFVLRVRSTSGRERLGWGMAGSTVMGTGIWSMHFVGMLAFRLPMPIGFSGTFTLASWAAAVAASGVALSIAGWFRFTFLTLWIGALAMGAGICAMHYVGMMAMDMVPGIVWNKATVALSIVVAVGASAAALAIFHQASQVQETRRVAFQSIAAVLLGVAICGMHYIGMSAALFPVGSVCLSAADLGGRGMLEVVAVASSVILLTALFISAQEARNRRAADRWEQSLRRMQAQLVSANESLEGKGLTDPVTGLRNRRFFESQLEKAFVKLDQATEPGAAPRLVVMCIGLDGFKAINDSFGHEVGDALLECVAERLRLISRPTDTVARGDGDKFLFLLEDAQDTAACLATADQINRSLARQFIISGKKMHIASSVGLVINPDGEQSEKIVANAVAAMRFVKRAGGGGRALFEPHMAADISYHFDLLNDLRHAVETSELELYYQPKIDGRRGKITGVEALIRWNHPVQGMIGPDTFIPLAERSGLIAGIGNWVINEACRQIVEWRSQGLRMRVAVNVSVYQLRERGLAERIGATLQVHGIDASQLLCEITESVAMEDLETTQRTFNELRSIGVFLSIDDFGTGYSSLSYLRQLPAKQLKIDKSFVKDLEVSKDARAIVEAVIQLAHALDFEVVAEGVETGAQGEILLQLGCDQLQGFFFARPMPAQDLLDWAVGKGTGPQGRVDFSPSSLIA